ncbi:o-succinylbenzoate synthase [Rhodocytophaga aerolata]|uniref:O-succinylbenzoate synthase n=1 Tax=Rhodocytophaga aerolata TaxID=455078 RepID=A0ABT8RDA6_9BACT|nr:o-succinylbenzoate synthase [Rhodocytophaga aerolata]MDO1448690.1 o-succinylbenzoate synthase [Rhodocytophaga aerolata]
MFIKADYQKYTLHFKFEAGTSRGVLTQKDTYFVKIWNRDNPQVYGIGECSVLKGLSIDDKVDYESYLANICAELSDFEFSGDISVVLNELIGNQYPSIQFGIETALLDLLNGGNRIIYPSPFTDGKAGVPINGLIWMGAEDFMRHQIDLKLEQGYTCLKLKIGALDFAKECALLEYIRSRYSPEQVTLRVDANGAFSTEEALQKLDILSQFELHSIEQPIRQGQVKFMHRLCRQTPLPIALDEELIGVMTYKDKASLLDEITPQYIILKPSLLGGFQHSLEWIKLCEARQIGWWITSALESNIGLNAISQFTAVQQNTLPQGLGTGQLYTNNIDSPLEIASGKLYYTLDNRWKLPSFI